MSNIFKRVSHRKFKETKVESDKIELLLKAAMAAPSAGNQQPWEFYVVTNEEKLLEISECSPYSKLVKNAPLAVIVCGRQDYLPYPELVSYDASAACENILLQATDLDLGGVWVTMAPYEDRMANLSKVLDMKSNVLPYAVMAIGYPLEEKQQQSRYDETRVHYIK